MSAELFFCDFCKSAEIQKVSFQATGVTIIQYKWNKDWVNPQRPMSKVSQALQW